MRTLLVAIALLASACGGDSATSVPTASSVAGVYRAVTIDGKQLPYVGYFGNERTEIVSQFMIIKAEGTFTDTREVHFISPGGAVRVDIQIVPGFFTMSGEAASFQGHYQTTISNSTGTFSHKTLTLNDVVYTRVAPPSLTRVTQ